MHSIRFCDEELLQKLKQVQHIKDYLEKKHIEIKQYNKEQAIEISLPVNGRILTNIGIFRIYLEYYLRSNPHLHHGMTFFVRQLASSAEELPLEVYVFTHRTTSDEYEKIQADMFNHVLAVLPYFDLRVFQNAMD